MKTRIALIVAAVVLLIGNVVFFLTQPAGARLRARLVGLISPGPPTGSVIEVRSASGETMPADLLARVRALPGVTAAEAYLLIQTDPHPIIGVEPGAPLRVISIEGAPIAEIASGESFTEADRGQPVVIAGRSVAQEDFGGGGGMFGMRHGIQVGVTFALPETRVRVIGVYRAASEPAERAVFLPLDMAQKIFGLDGQVSIVFVTLMTSEAPDQAAAEVARALGDQVVVTVK